MWVVRNICGGPFGNLASHTWGTMLLRAHSGHSRGNYKAIRILCSIFGAWDCQTSCEVALGIEYTEIP